MRIHADRGHVEQEDGENRTEQTKIKKNAIKNKNVYINL
jgi:hypothetical protein